MRRVGPKMGPPRGRMSRHCSGLNSGPLSPNRPCAEPKSTPMPSSTQPRADSNSTAHWPHLRPKSSSNRPQAVGPIRSFTAPKPTRTRPHTLESPLVSPTPGARANIIVLGQPRAQFGHEPRCAPTRSNPFQSSQFLAECALASSSELSAHPLKLGGGQACVVHPLALGAPHWSWACARALAARGGRRALAARVIVWSGGGARECVRGFSKWTVALEESCASAESVPLQIRQFCPSCWTVDVGPSQY